jgi:hypothetical protein
VFLQEAKTKVCEMQVLCKRFQEFTEPARSRDTGNACQGQESRRLGFSYTRLDTSVSDRQGVSVRHKQPADNCDALSKCQLHMMIFVPIMSGCARAVTASHEGAMRV